MKSNLTLQTELATNEDIDEETRRKSKKVVQIIGKVGASYLTEIAWEAGMTEYHTKIILNHLHSIRAVEEIKVSMTNPDIRLLGRVYEMSNRGQGGYEQFCRKRWYGLPEIVLVR